MPLQKKLGLAISFFVLVNLSIIVLSIAIISRFLNISKSESIPLEMLGLGLLIGISLAIIFFGAAKITLRRTCD
jgi:hypothetical protein|tara:strand:+ start:491 stop:712 length:222 start_codon:yes stop_codon:yes gene_type:complete